MQAYSRPMFDFVALEFSILIGKMLSYGKSMSSNLAFMPVANKVGQKVKKFILRFFRKNTRDDYQERYQISSSNIFWMTL